MEGYTENELKMIEFGKHTYTALLAKMRLVFGIPMAYLVEINLREFMFFLDCMTYPNPITVRSQACSLNQTVCDCYFCKQ